jgi:uncharacterized membrane protein (UPF0182 family)
VAMRPPMPNLALSRRAKIALSVVGILIVLLIAASSLTGVYVNWLWYGSVHYRQVYRTMLWTRIILFLIFGVLMALIIAGNLVIAYLLRPPFRPMSAEQQNLERYRVMVEPRKILILIAVSVIALFAAGLSAQGKWSSWQLWLNGASFHQTDPQFHRDISFYAWDYPVYRIMLGFGFSAIIFALILSIAVHYLSGAIRLQTPGPKITPSARRHLTMLVFFFMALKAVAYWLDRYGLVFNDRDKFTGAAYTDVHAALPAKTILFWIAILIALGVLASMWLRSSLLPGIGFVSMLVLSILISGIYPALVQQISVKPNASTKEATYISRNIAATREAYDINTSNATATTPATNGGTINYLQYPATASPDSTALLANNATMNNIRILDPNVVSPTFTQQQRIKNPYGFAPTLSMDRYTVADPITGEQTEHDYVVGVREQEPSLLTGSQGNWINSHTVYTHGYGFVAAQADVDVTNGKSSDYTEGDIPPTGPLGVSQPDVYYGQLMNTYSIVGAAGTPREYDGTGATNVTYKGTGGVSLSSLATRLAFAVHFKQTNFLLNDTVSASGAKIIYNRDPRVAVEKVAPFLTVDGDPYPAVVNGRIVWIVDAYTTMANYPYSERQSLSSLTGTSVENKQSNTQINYIRNSVKATVDAYNGTVTLYDWDSTDPILKSWMKVFPGLVKPKSDMPPEVLSHVRYPEDLFDVQRALIGTYHVSNPVELYNVRDKWTVPTDPFAGTGNQPSYYVLADPPDGSSTQPQFQLTTPMVVNNSTNLAAYISVDSDAGPGGHYGQVTVLEVPTTSAIDGPQQVANVFKTNSQISEDITLLDTGQSQIIHGNLLTLPVGSSFLYVEPLYVQAQYPTLQRVLLTYGNKIGYGQTLLQALSDFLPGHVTGQTLPGKGATTGNGGTTGTVPATGTSSTPAPSTSSSPSSTPTGALTAQQALVQVNSTYTALQNAYKSGNPATIGNAEAALQTALGKYLALVGTGASASSTPTAPATSPSTSK